MDGLSKEVAASFRLAPKAPLHFVHPDFGEIDLRTINKKQAKSLIDRGLKYLIPIEKKKKQ